MHLLDHVYRTLKEIETKMNTKCVPLTIPVGHESSFSGVIDLLKMKYLVFSKNDDGMTINEEDIPADIKDDANLWREHLLDSASEFSDEVMEKYLNGDEITKDEILVFDEFYYVKVSAIYNDFYIDKGLYQNCYINEQNKKAIVEAMALGISNISVNNLNKKLKRGCKKITDIS